MNAFILRMNPSGNDLVPEGLRRNLLMTGWSETDDLLQLPDWEDFRIRIETAYYPSNPNLNAVASNAAGAFKFIHRLAFGDLVVVPHGKELFIARVTGPCYFDASGVANDSAHRRKASWLCRGIPRPRASDALRRTLRFPGTCCEANDLLDDIQDLISRHRSE